jgi:hypothetical protein
MIVILKAFVERCLSLVTLIPSNFPGSTYVLAGASSTALPLDPIVVAHRKIDSGKTLPRLCGYQGAICRLGNGAYNFFCGLSPACRVPIVQFVAHSILALSLVLNLGVNINLNASQLKEGTHMVKTTKTTKVAATDSKKATGLGCV